ncbi:hypothetical protein ACPC54_29600 [Kitasatospora sp. NPDC094028]
MPRWRWLAGAYLRRVAGRLGIHADPGGTPISYLVSCTMDPWLTDTERGDFIPVLREALAEGARAAIGDVFPEPAR